MAPEQTTTAAVRRPTERHAPRPRKTASGGVNVTTVVGLLGALLLLGFVAIHEGDIFNYLNLVGFIIVFGGVCVGALIAFQGREIMAALRAFGAIFSRDAGIRTEIAELVEVARQLSGRNIHQAEERIARITSPFLKLGLQLVIDGTPVDDLMHIMNWRIRKMAEIESAQARFFRTLATLAPGFGLLGTLAGMVAMLRELGNGDIERVGSGMAVAMLATLYGVVLSNLIFKPIAIKIEQRTQRRVAMLNILLEGILLVSLGRSAGVVSDAMEAFLNETRDEISDV
ncbi:MotA/TolQ/ExbB proton channel family protein [Ferrovibrio sp.]|uniref:motility protein A n=1 Tax=Ferrovibrio sp. TaxID=1917215 RepID=UPI0025C46A89|nr:MotA/TolQ/ExbB proton channel family protein [Ferrovibrio sp.]MBX3453848.1 MotA/TolQ/ExbB proton channel family protein [Ferrovibrio sp.]